MCASKKKSAKRKSVLPKSLEAVNLNAAGIDIGSTEHYVAVPEDRCENPVRTFGCYTPDLHRMVQWLRDCGIETVALESTGVYWIPTFDVLEQAGFEVLLVDKRQANGIPGRKSDVQDSQWLQNVHTFGLLRGCFRPSAEIVVMRTYWRHRGELVELASRQIQLMQKSLEQMNLQLHKAISDITGVTGMAILRSIVAGERDPKVLAKMRRSGVKSTEEEIVAALTGNWREEHLFTLKQSLDLYDTYQQKIAECDSKIEEHMSSFPDKGDPDAQPPKKKAPQSRRKNEPHFDLGQHLFRIVGVDLTAIDGISALTAQTIISECGFDMSRFPTEKHFASWLGLCPNNRITGGKARSRRTRHVQSRAASALRLAAQSLHKSKTALGAFLRRMKARHGAPKAITATAHKLACLAYRMLKFGMEYVDLGQQHYEQKYHENQIRSLQKQARSLGFQILCPVSGEVS